MAAADEIRIPLTSSTTEYSAAIEARNISSQACKVLGSWMCERKTPARPAVHRTLTAVDTAGMTSASNTFDVGNSQHVACYVEGTPSNARIELCLGLYDAADPPAMLGITDFNTFSLDTYLVHASECPSPRYIYDVSGASRVRAFCKTLDGTSPSIKVRLVAL